MKREVLSQQTTVNRQQTLSMFFLAMSIELTADS